MIWRSGSAGLLSARSQPLPEQQQEGQANPSTDPALPEESHQHSLRHPFVQRKNMAMVYNGAGADAVAMKAGERQATP
jgi:hypothetical protein